MSKEKLLNVPCAMWKSSPHQKLMLAPAPEVVAEAMKPRNLDPHASVDYPDSQESSSLGVEEEEEEETEEESSDGNLDLK
ncbi:hypothetical protein K3495_g13335 [Podosphaera aphanis]|nr:hypothetical protein K3495_g13335 [Podosphaera aphanis]